MTSSSGIATESRPPLCTMHEEPVRTVLRQLHRREQEHDFQAFADLGIRSARDFPLHLDAADCAELLRDVMMAVPEQVGEALYLLARAVRARTVVEYGTSFGVSAIYLASAVRDNGGGTVIGTELQPDKAETARANFAAAGMADLIDLRTGDARDTLNTLPDSVDLVFLDGWPDLAVSVLKLIEPSLHPGSMVVVNDAEMDYGTDVHHDLRQHLDDPANGYVAANLPFRDGFKVCLVS